MMHSHDSEIRRIIGKNGSGIFQVIEEKIEEEGGEGPTETPEEATTPPAQH